MLKQRQYFSIDANSLFMPWLVALLVLSLGTYFDLYPQWQTLSQLRGQTAKQQQQVAQMIANVANRPIYQQWVQQLPAMANKTMADWLAKFGQYFTQRQLTVHELSIDNSQNKAANKGVHIIVQGSYVSIVQLLQHFIQVWDNWHLRQWYLQKQDDETSAMRLVMDIQYV